MTDDLAHKRVGVVMPSVNTVIERWFPSVLPKGVSLHTQRLPSVSAGVGEDAVRAMDAHAVEAARTLGDCRPDVLLYACTGSSFVGGPSYDQQLLTELETETGIPTVTAAGALLQALDHFGVRRLVVVTPYPDEMGKKVAGFLGEAGYKVDGDAHMGIRDGFELAAPLPSEIISTVRAAWDASGGQSDAVVIACLNLGAHTVVAHLEAELGVPVVSATQASLWAVLQKIGREPIISGQGKLLAGETMEAN